MNEAQRRFWECIYCGHRKYEPELELAKAVCKCGRGQGRWRVNSEPLLREAGIEEKNG